MNNNDKLLLNRFDIIGELGKGSFGTVLLVNDILTSKKVALKIIKKSQLKKASHSHRLRREINILRLLKHPNIVEIYEVLETENLVLLILEYVCGKDIFDHIIETKNISEDSCREIFRQIVSAMIYCHKNGIIHRDLKPENILLDHSGNIKIIDFGFVRTISENPANLLSSFCGSLFYCAPEMINGTPYYGPKADVWSLGIILFALTNGYLPFCSKNMREFYRSVNDGSFIRSSSVSAECKELIVKMLNINSENRITIDHVNEHSWTNKDSYLTPKEMNAGSESFLVFKKEIVLKLEKLESEPNYIGEFMEENNSALVIEFDRYNQENDPKLIQTSIAVPFSSQSTCLNEISSECGMSKSTEDLLALDEDYKKNKTRVGGLKIPDLFKKDMNASTPKLQKMKKRISFASIFKMKKET